MRGCNVATVVFGGFQLVDSHVRLGAVERGASSVTQVTFTIAFSLAVDILFGEDPVCGPVDMLQREVGPKEMSLRTYTMQHTECGRN